ncbi:MAG: acyltransferase family protein [Vulcanimicrobiaceae bacterium]
MSQTPDPSSRRIAYIDGLRAIAVLGVVAYHAAKDAPGVSQLAAPSSPLMLFFRQGCHGVDLFFVLSGFCLAYPTLHALHKKGLATFDVPAFMARRLVRIVPPYYAAIALFTALGYVLLHFGMTIPRSMSQHPTWLVSLRNALFIDGDGDFLTMPFWTLAVEFRWYFLFPFCLWLWARSHSMFLAAFAVAIALGVTRAGSVDVLVLPAFMLGIVAAALHASDVKIPRLIWPLLIISVALGVVSTSENWLNGLSRPWQLAAFLFVVGAGSSRLISRVLSARVFTAIGVASYSIYLIHAPVINLLEDRNVGSIPAAVIAIACGFLFWIAAERPFMAGSLRKRLLAELHFLPRWFAVAGLQRPILLRKAFSESGETRNTENDRQGDGQDTVEHVIARLVQPRRK